MKPRLDAAPLTVEDKTIWNRLADRNPSGTEWYNSTSQDRRDADLMYVWTRVQMSEEIDDRTWIRGGPDGDFVRIRPAALIHVDARL